MTRDQLAMVLTFAGVAAATVGAFCFGEAIKGLWLAFAFGLLVSGGSLGYLGVRLGTETVPDE